MALGHNPFSVYASMVKGAWGSQAVIHETIKIAGTTFDHSYWNFFAF